MSGIPSKSYWKNSIRLRGSSGWTLRGHSRAGEATGFNIPEIGMFLDAGCPLFMSSPYSILITHEHDDHCQSLPMLVKSWSPSKIHGRKTDVFVPGTRINVFQNFLNSAYSLGRIESDTDVSNAEECRSEGTTHTESALLQENKQYTSSDVNSSATSIGIKGKEGEDESRSVGYNINLKSAIPGTTYKIASKSQSIVTVKVIRTHHVVPSVGYIIYETKNKLKSEYKGRRSAEIRRLIAEGVSINDSIDVPVLAYLGDTTTEAFNSNPEIFLCNTIVTECTFLHPTHDQLCKKFEHSGWSQLEGIVKANPDIQFVFTHMSLRYSDSEIRSFFTQRCTDMYPNIVLFLDSAVFFTSVLKRGKDKGIKTEEKEEASKEEIL